VLNIAVIGAGRIGAVHAASVAAHPGARLTVVADPFGDGAAALAAAYGARSTTRVEDVYESADVDAVIIGSPTPLHVDQIVASVRAGKAVLCEKPVDLSVERVDECLAAIAGREHRVMMGFNRRFDPGVAEIHSRVRAGEIGALEQLTIISRDPAAPPAAYVAQSGGIFRDMTIHDLDMAAHFLGEIVEVTAVGQNLDPDIAAAGDFDAAVVTLTAASGAVATIVNSRHCATGYDQRLEAFGPLGSLELGNVTGTSVRHHGARGSAAAGPYLSFFLERYADAYRLELDHFIRSVTTGVAPSPGLVDGRTALVLADAATRSAHGRERVPVDGALLPAGLR
jgi:myo-inositol 2-dehydrogenase / D-chiro-inositol 1-dehydrogenase